MSSSNSQSNYQEREEDVDSKSTPAFLLKTFNMVSDPATNHVVSWNEKGDAFIVKNEHEFAVNVLPVYFRHKNFSSFVRQLNFYGFRKRSNKSSYSQFSHPLFLRGEVEKLKLIHRKTADASLSSNVKEAISSLQTQVSELKEQYDHVWKIQHQILFILSQFVRGSPDVQALLAANNTPGNKRRLLPQQASAALPRPMKRRQLLMGNAEEDANGLVEDEANNANHFLHDLAQIQEIVDAMPKGSSAALPGLNLSPLQIPSTLRNGRRTGADVTSAVPKFSPAFGYNSVSAPPFPAENDIATPLTRYPTSQGLSITEILPDSEAAQVDDHVTSQWGESSTGSAWHDSGQLRGGARNPSLQSSFLPGATASTSTSFAVEELSHDMANGADLDTNILAGDTLADANVPLEMHDTLFDLSSFGSMPGLSSINANAAPPFTVPSHVATQFPAFSSAAATPSFSR